MRPAGVQAIVDAVLYEGYALYPYRASSLKNRQRWTFGGLYPTGCRAVCEGAERNTLQAQVLVEGTPDTVVSVGLGFLQAIDRQPARFISNSGALESVAMLDVDQRRYVPWQEACEREVESGPLALASLVAQAQGIGFRFDAAEDLETLTAGDGSVAGALRRTRVEVSGIVVISAEQLDAALYRLTVTVTNQTPVTQADAHDAAGAARRALLSAHLVLSATDGRFVSAIDPPDSIADAAKSCVNAGCFPVLVGDAGRGDTVLCSPIILYDYPQIAAESAGELFDSTEIDEILTLRILTMTDAEKREMAALDDRVAGVLARAEALGPEAFAQLHGAWRSLRPAGDLEPAPWDVRRPELAFLRVGDRDLRVTDKVRLNPKRTADIIDIALAGKTATIEAIERDFEDAVHVAVIIDDDPGRDLGAARMPGHRFFFAPDELEPLS